MNKVYKIYKQGQTIDGVEYPSIQVASFEGKNFKEALEAYEQAHPSLVHQEDDGFYVGKAKLVEEPKRKEVAKEEPKQEVQLEAETSEKKEEVTIKEKKSTKK